MKYCPLCGEKLHRKTIDENKRYVCDNEDCGYVHWNNPTPVVAALVKYNDNYVIARNTLWPRGVFSVITGYLEKNESPEEAAVREVSEELGLSGKVTRHIGNYIFRKKNQLILCYEVEAAGSIEINYELAEVKQLSPRELSAYDFSPLYIPQKIVRDWVGFPIFSVRRAGAADIDEFKQVVFTSVLELCKNHYTPEELKSLLAQYPERNVYEEWLYERVLVVAEQEGTLVGFAQYFPSDNSIEAVHVLPTYTKRGIGKMLMEAIEGIARKQGMTKINLGASLNAVNFYEKCGYTRKGNGAFRCKDGTELAVVNYEKILCGQK